METKEYTTSDRKSWPDGPWMSEPDKVQWEDESTGLPCLAVRHPRSGHWCGYVGVPPGHAAHSVVWDDLHDLTVHCGVNYTKPCDPRETESAGVCHIPGPGEPHDVWWLGFDCAHSGDMSYFLTDPEPFGTYRTLDFVRAECQTLAAQLKEL
jgi:hypothetical protein